MSHTITAPAKTPGKVSTYFGPHNLVFDDGVATFDGDLSDGLKAYLLGHGYDVDGTSVTPDTDPTPVDSRDADTPVVVGTELRDAAVDPRDGDFLAPTNAGQGDPHGPDVVSPEVHASQGVRPVLGGDVHVDNPATQDDRETEHAAASTDGTPVVAVERPAGNASRETWAEYALAAGASANDIDGKSRDEIRDAYPAPAEA